ncbi:MAG: NmrA family transcriptional regulator [Ectothiorhodospiraceae bacterium]|nr:NmrA family transcriptional regulator [Chromatiales bacterium]MCP5154390.1 NmrA family transcriptional regulator [Ectothiorhodospiraceae bacterium]
MPNTTIDHRSSQGTIAVLGGTGKTGRRVAARLAARGVPTRVASRRGTPAFHWGDPSTWDAVLEGATSAYVSYAPDLAIPGAAQTIEALTERAVAHGLRRLVLLSGRGETEAQRCEAIVARSGLEWTVVRASWFAQNFSEGEFLDMVRGGAITLPAADVPEPFVDIEDLADVVVAALTGHGHGGQIYEVTGPRALTFSQAARELSRASGRPVHFVRIPKADFAAGVAAAGTPPDVAWLLEYLFDTVLDGRNVHPGDGVQRALGRDPVDFGDFARRAAAEGVWRAAA